MSDQPPSAPRGAQAPAPAPTTAAARAGDLAVSLPTDTATFSAVGMFPVGRVDTHHLLLLADDVSRDEVESLALSQDEHAGWVGASRLQLAPGAELQGPWAVDGELRELLALPAWTAQVWLLECEPQRSGPLPRELAGIDAMSDAFPLGQPAGTELVALIRLRAIARRLAGGLRLVGDAPAPGRHAQPAEAHGAETAGRPVLLIPDPDASVGLSVYAPVWIDPDALAAILAPVAPGARPLLQAQAAAGPTGLDAVPRAELDRLAALLGEDALDEAWRAAEKRRAAQAELEAAARAEGRAVEEVRDGYAVVAPVDAARPEWGQIEVRVLGAEHLPLAVRGEAWARGGVVVYTAVWMPPDPADARREEPSGEVRRARDAAREQIERVASVLARAALGVAVDDDGFLVAL